MTARRPVPRTESDPGRADGVPLSVAALWPLATGTFVIGLGSFVMSGLVPSVADDLGLSLAEAGALVGVYGFTYAVSTPVLTILTRRVPRLVLLRVSLVAFSFAALATAFATDRTSLVVLRVVAAVVAGGFTPTATVLASRLVAPERRGVAVATVFGGMTAATVLGAPVGNLLGPVVGYRGVYAGVAVVSALAAVAVTARVRSVPAGGDARPVGRSSRASTWVVLALVVSCAETSGALMVQTYGAALLGELLGATGAVVSAVLLMYGVAGVAGNVVGGVLSDRVGPARVLVSALVVAAGALALLPLLGTTPLGAGAVMLVWGFAAWAMNSPLQNVLLGLAGRHGQLVVALNSSVISLGTGIGATVGGAVVVGQGLVHVAWAGSLTTAGGAVLALVLMVVVRRRTGASEAVAGPVEVVRGAGDAAGAVPEPATLSRRGSA